MERNRKHVENGIKLSHFTGYRFALSYYSSRLAGGIADFSGFQTGQEVYGDEKNK